MKLSLRAVALLPCTALLIAVASTAHAQITSATVYLNTPFSNDASNPANEGSTLESANFTVGASGINFNTSDSPSTSISTFLNNPTFSNEQNGFDPNGITNNSEIVISGFATLNAGANSFVVGHDDGVVLDFPAFGDVVDAPGPTSISLSPFTVNAPTAGSYAFTLDYAETDGGPADLDFTVNTTPITSAPSPTPEPSGLILLGTGVLGAAGMLRRRFSM